ncbi:oxidoreductase [Mycobacterium deserti]|uniref:Oxidoreductase n=1 Tax=Mycobacterium deserti TaxID=2978347 RepID=A0ABT2MEK9_9MYCO|nr:oxidoreductase [Mycobacterium deserti]MCT7660707.1 oxidoreductase [Mycobacterium deserti]
MTKTFLITGVSKGLGRAFSEAALEAGHTVVGTVRKPDQISEFEALKPGSAHGRLLDVTDYDSIPKIIADVESSIGPIDVLINNAGYGVEGTFEETPPDVWRQQFEVNVFGLVEVTRAVLPHMRARRSGQLVFISSIGGLRAFAGLSAYHGTKYAVEGIADSLRAELAGLGIQVITVEPGSFRTDWAGGSMTRVERSIPDYAEVFDPIRERRNAMNGYQLGDAAKGAKAVLTILEEANPPGHFLIGADAMPLVMEARSAVDAEFAAWAELSADCAHPDGMTHIKS